MDSENTYNRVEELLRADGGGGRKNAADEPFELPVKIKIGQSLQNISGPTKMADGKKCANNCLL